MKPTRKKRQSGQALIEFTLVGVPLIFVLICIFEISRGMWIYHTLAYSVKDGTRFAAVHGINCVNTPENANDCTTSIAAVAAKIRFLGVGLDPSTTTLTFTPGTVSAATTCVIGSSCGAITSIWPPYDSTGGTTPDAIGKPIQIDIRTPFNSALAMLWPGAGSVKFANGTLGASSRDYIQF